MSLFQSTLPLRGATSPFVRAWYGLGNFNPHSPCGERPPKPAWSWCPSRNFNPHSPCGERPNVRTVHAVSNRYFNPHSPCGERPNAPLTVGTQTYFNPHSPCGERLRQKRGDIRECLISIHTPLAGSDNISSGIGIILYDFNPHSPCGERLYTVAICV